MPGMKAASMYVYDACREVDSLRQTLEVNVVGVHAMIQAFLPLLQSGHKKTVINISSGSGSLSRRYDEVITMACKLDSIPYCGLWSCAHALLLGKTMATHLCECCIVV